MKLYIGNKNYSSWSMRPWVAMTAAGIPFEEEIIWLDEADTAARLSAVSPSKRIPVLVDENLTVWDSLSICEYVHEKYPALNLWPDDKHKRAYGRSLTAEMHSGFSELRQTMNMNIRLRLPLKSYSDTVARDINRIQALWTESLQRYGGPWLLGATFSIADAFYAPVVMRFQTYSPSLNDSTSYYRQRVIAHPAVAAWIAAANTEGHAISKYDHGQPE